MRSVPEQVTADQGIRGTLRGVRVLEIGRDVAVPFAARVLTQLGATTTKVEGLSGDPSRRSAPSLSGVPGEDCGALFQYLNRGKQSLSLDLSTATGLAVLSQVAETSDIILADEWLLEELGQTRAVDWMRQSAGRVRMLLTAFGLSGPHASHKSSPLVSAHAGVAGSYAPLTVPEQGAGRRPAAVGSHWSESQCGLMIALATLDAVLDDECPFLQMSRQDALQNLACADAEYPSGGGRVVGTSTSLPWDPWMCAVDDLVGLDPRTLRPVEVAGREFHWPSWPAAFGGVRSGAEEESDAPVVGEHTVLVLKGLGYESAQIHAMLRFGIARGGSRAGVPV